MRKTYILVGTYTSGGQSEGFYIFEMNTETGGLEQRSVCKCENPSFIELRDPYLFAVNETENSGCVSSYQWNRKLNTIKELSKMRLPGGASCHLSLWQDARHISVSNYASGFFVTCGVNEDGMLSEITDIKENTGCGPVKERQEQAHSHSLTRDQRGHYFIGADLGGDTLYIYQGQSKEGSLVPNPNQPCLKLSDGEGPRHMVFHASNRYLYLVTELGNHIISYEFHEATGTLTELQKIPLIPVNYEGPAYGADLHISRDGRFLYTSVRGYDRICVYSIHEKYGLLSHIGDYSCYGSWPRNFCITPDDSYLVIANQYSNNIVVCERKRSTGAIGRILCEVTIAQPVYVKAFGTEENKEGSDVR